MDIGQGGQAPCRMGKGSLGAAEPVSGHEDKKMWGG